ncbi:Transcription initiation factor TFIID subunit 5 [Wallemia ichthyophaga EXF-994]|uniref:Transcription initiation factor TFIID subunit 5 n=1 Tax=Wallemia ichthyophaga (strain EXF-994 / CBS 113033) TaxID=1299270 RepID=R9APP1_WALI9|nr:Transcription initiation factor TFIID subunit 5 [Wallemia ichthyophaga EXF-994]EOR04182.1 Transcription initiation factor TFIID subunit 5 [Wallemia ichthyophaga EXF-994]
MTDFVQHDPYFREWHKRNNTHASLISPAAAAGGIIDASSAQASIDDDEDNNHASDNVSIDKADAPPPQGVAPDAKKVYDQEPVPQAEREDVERAIKKDTDNKDQSDASDVKSGLAAGSAAAIAGAAGVAVAAASTDENPEPTPQHSDPHPPTAAQVDAPTILHAPKDTKVVTEVTKDESKMNTNEPVTTEAPAPTGTAEDTVVPETKEEPVTAAQPQPTNTTESTIVPEPVEKDEQKQKQEQPKEKLNAFEETPVTTPKEESPAPIAAPAPSVPSKANHPALPKGVVNLKADGPRKPEGISTPAGEHVPIYPGDTPDTPDISGKPNPVTVTVPLETVQLTDAEGTHIPVTEEGGDTTAVENAKDPKPEPISKDKVDAPIESKQKLPEEAHNAATWTTLPGPEEVPTPLRLSQRSPETPLAPSLEESPHSAEEQKKQKKTEEEKKRSDKAEEEAKAKEAQESGENKIVPPKTPEKAKFQQDQNSHLETPNAGQSTAPSMSPGNSSIKSATNLPGGYQQSPEKAGKEEEGEGQQSSSIMKSCLIKKSENHHDIVLEYLRRKGFSGAEEALKSDLTSKGINAGTNNHTQTLEELARQSADSIKNHNQDDNIPPGPSKDSVLLDLVKLASNDHLGKVTTDRLLLTDPTERERGFRDLDRWVEGSLDVYRPQLRPILFPIFVHTYLDLISLSFQKSARAMLHRHAHSLIPYHADVIAHLGSLTLPAHVKSDPLAIRWRSQKYIVRLGKAAWNLLLGWLSDALVGGPGGSSTGGTAEAKGRSLMLKIVNERLRVDVVESSTKISQEMIEESTGLISDLTITYPTIPGQRMAIAQSAQSFNNIIGELKLGLPPLDDGLRAEVDRQVAVNDAMEREEGMEIDPQQQKPQQPPPQQEQPQQQPQSQQPSDQGAQSAEATPTPNPPNAYAPGAAPAGTPQDATAPPPPAAGEIRDENHLLAPTRADLPPLPVFRTADVRREVEKVFDSRKRINLGVELEKSTNGVEETIKSKVNLPSICAFTLQDVGDELNCSTFSPDSSILAAGLSDSTVRLWNLRNESFTGLRDDFDREHPPSSMKKLKLDTGLKDIKFVGHSGPVFGLSFDPSFGTPVQPRHLISSSADSTVRLWSLETYSNLAVYRGHRDPVWDCEWGPFGIYFATASRDRTARLWSAERPNALRIFAGHLGDVETVKFHPNSLYLATGSQDRTARLWDVQRGACVRIFIGHQAPLSTMALSPDGKYLATASDDLSISLWDLGSGKRIKKMLGHTAQINSLNFDANSNLLISSSSDCSIRCWDILTSNTERPDNSTSDLLETFHSKNSPAYHVKFTPRNLCLAALDGGNIAAD